MGVDLKRWREMEAQCSGERWCFTYHGWAEGYAHSIVEGPRIPGGKVLSHEPEDAHIMADYRVVLPSKDAEAVTYFRNHAKEMADEAEVSRALLKQYQKQAALLANALGRVEGVCTTAFAELKGLCHDTE